MVLQLGHCLFRIKYIVRFMHTPTSDVMAVNVSLKLMGLDIAHLSIFKIYRACGLYRNKIRLFIRFVMLLQHVVKSVHFHFVCLFI